MYLMDSASRMSPPAIAKEPKEISITFRMNCPKNKKMRPTTAAVMMTMFIILRRSGFDIPSLAEMTKGKLPIASMTIKRGTKVNMNESDQLCTAPYLFQTSHDGKTTALDCQRRQVALLNGRGVQLNAPTLGDKGLKPLVRANFLWHNCGQDRMMLEKRGAGLFLPGVWEYPPIPKLP
jgi:hypothetical protein